MANDIVSDDIYSEKYRDNELIYFATIMCEILSEIEPLLKNYFPNDQRINLLLSVKNKWIAKFKSVVS
jgi:hypothetical protein